MSATEHAGHDDGRREAPFQFRQSTMHRADCFDWLRNRRDHRQIVRAALPLGEGIVLDPFAGAGSTLAACNAIGYDSIGIEKDGDYYRIAVDAVPKLTALGDN